MFTYTRNNKQHTDTSLEYMQALGINDDEIESILSLLSFELSKYKDNAISTRYIAIYAPLTIAKGDIDVGLGKDGVLGIDNIKDTLSAISLGMDTSNGIDWIMADNSVVNLTVDDIKETVIEFNKRKQSVFAVYGLWRSGDMSAPFVV